MAVYPQDEKQPWTPKGVRWIEGPEEPVQAETAPKPTEPWAPEGVRWLEEPAAPAPAPALAPPPPVSMAPGMESVFTQPMKPAPSRPAGPMTPYAPAVPPPVRRDVHGQPITPVAEAYATEQKRIGEIAAQPYIKQITGKSAQEHVADFPMATPGEIRTVEVPIPNFYGKPFIPGVPLWEIDPGIPEPDWDKLRKESPGQLFKVRTMTPRGGAVEMLRDAATTVAGVVDFIGSAEGVSAAAISMIPGGAIAVASYYATKIGIEVPEDVMKLYEQYDKTGTIDPALLQKALTSAGFALLLVSHAGKGGEKLYAEKVRFPRDFRAAFEERLDKALTPEAEALRAHEPRPKPSPELMERLRPVPAQPGAGEVGGIPTRAKVSGEAGGALRMEEISPARSQAEPIQISEKAVPPSSTTRAMVPPSSLGPEITFKAGDINQTSKHMIYQASVDVNALLRTAQETVEPFRSGLKEVVGSAKAEGIADVGEASIRVKGMERVQEKIESKYPPEEIGDYLGARVPVDSVADASVIVKNLSQMGRIISDRDFYENPEAGYRSRHLQIELENGLSVEVQLPVKEMYEAQLQAHKQYNIFRNSTDANAVRKAMLESESIFSEAWQKYQQRVSGQRERLPELQKLYQPRGGERAVAAKVEIVPSSEISTDLPRFQPRAEIDEGRVYAIAESMRERGYDPAKAITLWRDVADGKTYVLAGHHRLLAARRAGIEDVPSRFFEGTESEAVDYAWRSNSTRAPLSPISEARAFAREIEQGLPVKEIATRYGGVKESVVTDRLALNNLAPELLAMVDSGTLKIELATALGRAVGKHKLSPEIQTQVFDHVIKKMEVTPAELTTMIDTIAPYAQKQLSMGLGFQMETGFVEPLMEMVRDVRDLQKSKRRLGGLVKEVKAREKKGKPVSANLRAAAATARKHIADVQREIQAAEKKLGLGKAPKRIKAAIAKGERLKKKVPPKPVPAKAEPKFVAPSMRGKKVVGKVRDITADTTRRESLAGELDDIILDPKGKYKTEKAVDAKRIAKLLRSSIDKPETQVFELVVEGKAVGWQMVADTPGDYVAGRGLIIHPEVIESGNLRGLGTQLIHNTLRELAKQGKGIHFKANPAADIFFDRFGFEKELMPERFPGDTEINLRYMTPAQVKAFVEGKGKVEATEAFKRDVVAMVRAGEEQGRAIEGEALTAEMAAPSRAGLDVGKEPIEEAPLFGGPAQAKLGRGPEAGFFVLPEALIEAFRKPVERIKKLFKPVVERIVEEVRPEKGAAERAPPVATEILKLGKDLEAEAKALMNKHMSLREIAMLRQTEAVAETGTMQPKKIRPLLRHEGKVKTVRISEKDLDNMQARFVALGRRVAELRDKAEVTADPLTVSALRMAQDQFKGAAKELQKARKSWGRMGHVFQRQVSMQLIQEMERLGITVGNIKNIKKRAPIIDGFVKAVRERDLETMFKHSVDYLRINLFTVGSWTLDFGGDVLSGTGKAAGWAASDIFRMDIANGHTASLGRALWRESTSLMPGRSRFFTKLSRAEKSELADLRQRREAGEVLSAEEMLRHHELNDKAIFRLPPNVETGLGKTAGGEIIPEMTEAAGPAVNLALAAPLKAKVMTDTAFKRTFATAEMVYGAGKLADSYKLTGPAREMFIEDVLSMTLQEVSAKYKTSAHGKALIHQVKQIHDNAIRVGNEVGFNVKLSGIEERIARSRAVQLFGATFARWPFQAGRWLGRTLGADPRMYELYKSGRLTPDEALQWAGRAAAGWGGVYLLNQVYDNFQFVSKTPEGGIIPNLRYLNDDGTYTRVSGRFPIPDGLFVLAMMKYGAAKAQGDEKLQERYANHAWALLPYLSIPAAPVIGGEPSGLLSNWLDTMRDASRGHISQERMRRELDNMVNRAIPGQALLGAVEAMMDPTARRGVGAGIPFYSETLPPVIKPTTGEPYKPMQQFPPIPGVPPIPAMGGLAFPGGKVLTDPVEAVLLNHGIGVFRPRRAPLAEFPAEDVPQELRQQYEVLAGKKVNEMVSRVIAMDRFWETDYKDRAVLLNSLVNRARAIARAQIIGERGEVLVEEPKWLRNIPERQMQRPVVTPPGQEG